MGKAGWIGLGLLTVATAMARPAAAVPALTYSSYLAGSGNDRASCVARDPAGNVWVAGNTNSLGLVSAPQTVLGPRGGTNDVFLARFSTAGQPLSITYLGGSGDEMVQGLALDAAGNVYLALQTSSTDLPVLRAVQSHLAGSLDGALISLDPTGTSLRFSTYLGGSAYDYISGLAVDGAGHIALAGTTASADFPVHAALQPTRHGGSDAFAARLSFDGTQLVTQWSTYLGGGADDDAYRVAVDPQGNVYLSGDTYSADFPTANPVQTGLLGTADGFVSEIKADGSGLVYSTYLGGASDSDWIYGMAVDGAGAAYVVGSTRSADFRLVNPLPSIQRGSGSLARCFVAKIAPLGGRLDYATTLGGSGADEAKAIAVDAYGRALVGGDTGSADFPVSGAFQTTLRGTTDGFVALLSPTGNSLLFSSFYGGTGLGAEDVTTVGFAGTDHALFAGLTQATDLPLVHAAQSASGGGLDGFLAYLDLTGSAVPGLAAYTITPQSGNLATQVPFTVTGYGFRAGARVKLTMTGQADLVAQSVQVAADGASLTGRLDLTNQPTGSRTVVVVNPDNASATVPLPFVVLGTGPQINSVAPTEDYIGSTVTVTISGAHFVSGSTARLSRSGHATVAGSGVQMVSASQIRATFALPNDGAGLWNVDVVAPGGSYVSLPASFTVLSVALTLDGVDPVRCGNHVRLPLTLRGHGMASGCAVKLMAAGRPELAATGVQVAANGLSLTAWVDLRGQPAGARDVVATNPGGTPLTLAGGFTIDDGGLAVTSIWPLEAAVGETFNLTLEGAGFDPRDSVRLVRAGRAPITSAGIGVIGNERIQTSLPLTDATAGVWDVEVIGPLGQIASLPASLTVRACRISRVSPGLVSNDHPFTLSLTGGGLATVNQVTLTQGTAVVAGTRTHWDADTGTLSSVFDLHTQPAGEWLLAVARPDGARASWAAPLQVLQGFVIRTVDPARVENNGAANITLRGAGLRLAKVTLRLGGNAVWSGWAFADPTATALPLTLTGMDTFALGLYDIVVEPLGGEAITLPHALEVVVALPRVTSVTPQQVLSRGFVTLTLEGGELGPGCTVTLVHDGQADVAARSVVASAGRSELTAAFMLDGLAAGDWAVVAIRPDGKSVRLDHAVTVVAAPAAAPATAAVPDVTVTVTPDKIRARAMRAIYVTVANRGAMDAGGTLCVAGLPVDAEWDLQGPALPTGAPAWKDLATVLRTADSLVLVVPGVRLRPGQTAYYQVYLNVPTDRTFSVSASWAGY